MCFYISTVVGQYVFTQHSSNPIQLLAVIQKPFREIRQANRVQAPRVVIAMVCYILSGSSIGDGGFGAFLRNCAQTKPSPILRFRRMVHRMVFIFCAHIGKLYDPKNGKLYDPKNGKLYDPKKWKTI